MGIFFWILFGGLTGYLWETQARKRNELDPGKVFLPGTFHSVTVGILGALITGWTATFMTSLPTLIGINYASLGVPVLGAIAFLHLFKVYRFQLPSVPFLDFVPGYIKNLKQTAFHGWSEYWLSIRKRKI